MKKIIILSLLILANSLINAMEEREAIKKDKPAIKFDDIEQFVKGFPKETAAKIAEYKSFEKMPMELIDHIARSLISNVTNEEQAKNVINDLKRLSQVNSGFRYIINSDNFINYAILNLSKNANIDVVDIAIFIGNPVAENWLKKNIKTDQINSSLNTAVYKKDYNALKFLLNAGAAINTQAGRRALLSSIKNGDKKMVELLIEQANSDTKNEALREAIRNHDVYGDFKEIAKFLIQKGASLNAKDPTTGLSPIDLAREKADMAKILADSGKV